MDGKQMCRIGMWGLALALMSLGVGGAPALAQSANETPVYELESPEWSYEFSLYGVLMGLEGSVGGNAQIGGEQQLVDIDFARLTNYENFGGNLRFQAYKDRWSILTDWSFLSIDTEQLVRSPEDPRESVTAKNKTGQLIGELTGGYLFAEHWDLLLGLRMYSFDNDLKAGELQILDGRDNWVNAHVGLRFRNQVWEHWLLSFRGDVGMGGAKVATYFDFRARYTFDNEKLWIEGGLRFNYANREEGHPSFADYFKYKATTGGFLLGVGYNF